MNLDQPVVVFDCETTGVNFRDDRIVEIAAWRIECDGSCSDRSLDTYINPGVPIPADAVAIHGISDETVAGAPSFKEVATHFMQLVLTDPEAALGGFNVLEFDVPLLIAEYERAGLSATFLRGRPALDACKIFKLCEGRDLQSAVRFYVGDHIGAPLPYHRAGTDVEATVAVLRRQLDGRYPFLPETIAELDRFCRGRKADWVDDHGKLRRRGDDIVLGFGKYRGRLLREVCRDDPRYMRWFIGTPDCDPFVRRTILEALDAAH